MDKERFEDMVVACLFTRTRKKRDSNGLPRVLLCVALCTLLCQAVRLFAA